MEREKEKEKGKKIQEVGDENQRKGMERREEKERREEERGEAE